ncbi:MAG: hypothetical protein J0M24_00155 [Verrucomicrobia bacterium]|nr:hypothetical protein [Verrucomicrobiota bacterium]
MKSAKILLLTAFAGVVAFSIVGCQSDQHAGMNHGSTMADVKPYPLTKCIVSDDAFDHGTPVVFVYQGQEIKLCCQDCRKDFDKDPTKYLTKLAASK